MSDSTQLPEKGASRSRIHLQSIDFIDGRRIQLAPGEILVVVGPNNSGKSQLLRDVHQIFVSGSSGRPNLRAVDSITYEMGPGVEIFSWLEAVHPAGAGGLHSVPFVGRMLMRDLQDQWTVRDRRGLQALTRLFVLYLGTEERLSAANPTDLIDFVTQIPERPLHRLFDDDQLELTLSDFVKRSFGVDLVVNRSAGNKVRLHLGKRPTPPKGKDRIAKEYRDEVNQLAAVERQGDGVRAFVGVAASVLTIDADVLLLDEPEAFLHPPQAHLLGQFLAEQTPVDKQLLVATHSSDVLRGILDQASSRVRVVRLERDASGNRATELRPDQVRNVWKDPLLRFSKVLDGLFHDGVVVCEADGDCRFYAAISDAIREGGHWPDISWVFGSGKSRIATIAQALRAIGVPVRVVIDFDGLQSEDELKKIVESVGCDWSPLASDFNIVKSAIDQRRAQLSTEELKINIAAILDEIKQLTVPEKDVKKIRELLKRGSAWGEAKRMGKAFVPNGQQSAAYERLAASLQKCGIFLVEVGQLEGFCRTIDSHGPAWVAQVLERDLANDAELREAREFVHSIVRSLSASRAGIVA
jgi:energy-coupling factor transporter ATP-binding protein EcfA2